MLPHQFPSATIYARHTGEPALRWGIYGAGAIAGKWADAVHDHTNQHLAGVASRSVANAERFAATHGVSVAHQSFESLVNDPAIDAIYIATPHIAHLAAGLEVIAAGKHVLIEKPLTINAHEAHILTSAARAAGVFLMEGLWSRYHPQASVIQTLVTDGAIGEVKSVIANIGQGIPESYPHKIWDPNYAGGALTDIGVYPLQLDSMLLGAPDTITAVGSLAATGVDDSTTMILGRSYGSQSSLFTSVSVRTPGYAAICGTAGRIEVVGSLTGPGSLVLSDSGYFTPQMFWSDETGLRDTAALAWQVNAAAKFIGEGRLESPEHTHAETVSMIATLDEARRQVGTRGFSSPAAGELVSIQPPMEGNE